MRHDGRSAKLDDVNDTAPEIERKMVELYRKMTPSQKAERVRQLSQTVEQLALSDIRRRHPEESPREWKLRMVSRYLPADLIRRAFGWDPVLKGY